MSKEILIINGCNDPYVNNLRSTTAAEYARQYSDRIKVIIPSGGITSKDNLMLSDAMRRKVNSQSHLSESSIITHILQNHKSFEDFSHIPVIEENQSKDTAKNIRESLQLILDKNLIDETTTISMLTSAFHIERTAQFVEYIIASEFPELWGTQIAMIAAEDYATESQKRHLLNHRKWQEKIDKFTE